MTNNNYIDEQIKASERINTDDIGKELKDLPKLVAPDNFEYNLKMKISNLESRQKVSIFDKLFFPAGEALSRRMIFSTVVVLVCCSIVLGYLVIKHFSELKINRSNIVDSTYYEGKKVIVLPPTGQPQNNNTAEQPLQKYIEPKASEYMDKETLKKYIVPAAPSEEQAKTGLANIKQENDTIKTSTSKEIGGVKGKVTKKVTKKSSPIKK